MFILARTNWRQHFSMLKDLARESSFYVKLKLFHFNRFEMSKMRTDILIHFFRYFYFYFSMPPFVSPDMQKKKDCDSNKLVSVELVWHFKANKNEQRTCNVFNCQQQRENDWRQKRKREKRQRDLLPIETKNCSSLQKRMHDEFAESVDPMRFSVSDFLSLSRVLSLSLFLWLPPQHSVRSK